MKELTIYEALKLKLKREPTFQEINEDCRRIITKGSESK